MLSQSEVIMYFRITLIIAYFANASRADAEDPPLRILEFLYQRSDQLKRYRCRADVVTYSTKPDQGVTRRLRTIRQDQHRYSSVELVDSQQKATLESLGCYGCFTDDNIYFRRGSEPEMTSAPRGSTKSETVLFDLGYLGLYHRPFIALYTNVEPPYRMPVFLSPTIKSNTASIVTIELKRKDGDSFEYEVERIGNRYRLLKNTYFGSGGKVYSRIEMAYDHANDQWPIRVEQVNQIGSQRFREIVTFLEVAEVAPTDQLLGPNLMNLQEGMRIFDIRFGQNKKEKVTYRLYDGKSFVPQTQREYYRVTKTEETETSTTPARSTKRTSYWLPVAVLFIISIVCLSIILVHRSRVKL
jgi:hypothetical protein